MSQAHARVWCVPLVLFSAPVAAQQSALLVDAAQVVVPPTARIEHVGQLDSGGPYEALSWWWTDEDHLNVKVQGWQIDPVEGFTLLFSRTFMGVDSVPGPWLATLGAGDLDGDGNMDAVVTANDTTYAVRTNGLATPTEIQVVGTTTSSRYSFLEDLNGDGFADLVLIDEAYAVSVYMNGGPGVDFALSLSAGPQSLGSVGSRVQIAELSGDGVPDLLFVRADGIVVQALSANGVFGPLQHYPAAYPPTSAAMPAAGDVDGDGDTDVVVFSWDGANEVWVYRVLLRTGPSTLVLQPAFPGGPATDLADIDLDGDLDGVCCGGGGGPSNPYSWMNIYGSSFEFCHNDGRGAFTNSTRLPSLGASKIAAALDVDFDGDVELIAGRAVYWPRAPLTETIELPFVSIECRHDQLHDLEGDGDPDYRPQVEEPTLANDGAGGVGEADPVFPPQPPGTNWRGDTYPGDFDGDGDLDLIVHESIGNQFVQMRLLLNTGGGGFDLGAPAGAPGVRFVPNSSFTYDLLKVLVVDAEGDGDVDLIANDSPSYTQPTRIWLNDGSGFLSLGPTSFSDAAVRAAGDVNGDGHTDLVVARDQRGSSNNNLLIYHGNGTGSFNQSVVVDWINWFRVDPKGLVVLEDLDADSDLDLVVCNQHDWEWGQIILFTNNGSGGLSPTTLEPIGAYATGEPARIITADVDSDGWRDLVCSPLILSGSAAAFLLREPDGAGFRPGFLQCLRPVDSADVDGDGDDDLLDASYTHYLGGHDRFVKSFVHEAPAAGERLQVGKGTAGAGGMVPTLGATGPFRVHETVELHLTGACPGATGRLLVECVPDMPEGSEDPARPRSALSALSPVPPKTFTVTGGLGDPDGSGTWSLSFPVDASVAGLVFRYVVEIDDPAAAGGIAKSNALYLRFGE